MNFISGGKILINRFQLNMAGSVHENGDQLVFTMILIVDQLTAAGEVGFRNRMANF